MSNEKRVLVVDDSKSARLVLRRMLEKYELGVDTVESASRALDFLAHQRPDAIFMDHMMPGMDGFQAVKAIKANPQTATIPVMMYTSKGGDLYIGQARALGAVGVLPKTVAPAQLFESLRKIGLVQERRSEDRTMEEDGASERAEDIRHRPRTAPIAAVAAFHEPGMQADTGDISTGQLDKQLRQLLEEQRAEFRKDVLLSMENVARQTATRLNRELEEQVERMERAGPRHPGGPGLLPTLVLGGLLAASLVINLLMYTGRIRNDSPPHAPVAGDTLAGQVQAQTEAIAGLEARQLESQAHLRNSWETIAWSLGQSMHYPFDEIALDNQRVDTVDVLLAKLRSSGFRGKLILETHAGEFCLMGDEDKGFTLPPPDLTVDKCEFVGNPVQALDTAAAHQSLRFANFVASTPLLSDDGISLEVHTLPRSEMLSPYPEKSAETTALQWNEAAQANNLVSVQLIPAGAESAAE
jgi:CheY-like chemotaxis protein